MRRARTGGESTAKPFAVFGEKWPGRILRRLPSRRRLLIITWIVLGLIPQLLFLLAAKLDNTVLLDGKAVGLLEDYVVLSYSLYVPGCVSLALMLLPRFPDILDTLREEAVLFRPRVGPTAGPCAELASERAMEADVAGVTEEEFEAIREKCYRNVRGEGVLGTVRILTHLFALVWVVAITVGHWIAPEMLGYDSWNNRDHMAGFLTIAFHDFVVFGLVIPYFGWKYLAIAHSMRTVCKDLAKRRALVLRPLSPDQAGGLGFFGAYSLKVVTILVPPVATIMCYVYMRSVEQPADMRANAILIFGVVVYALVLTFSFLYPLSGAHDGMKRCKDREIGVIFAEYDRTYNVFMSNAVRKERNELRESTAILDRLERLHSRAEKMPVWPLNTATVTKFIGILAGLAASISTNWVVAHM